MLVLPGLLLLISCQAIAGDIPEKTRGNHLPLIRREVKRAGGRAHLGRRGGGIAEIGVGDYLDVTYNVLVQVGGIQTPLVLDTGSADLWVVSDACKENCSANVPLYPQSTLQLANQQVELLYGDSHTGTRAVGPIGKDTAGIAGLVIQDQYLAAIVETNTTVLETGSAGILGFGFPAISVLWRQLLQAQLNNDPPSKRGEGRNLVTRIFPDFNFRRPTFPSFEFLLPPSHAHTKRQNATLLSSAEVIASFATYGPLFTRLISQNMVESPMFAITLQRDTVDIGGNVGSLSIGELPNGIQTDGLTWVPLRAYTPQEGGLPPAPEAPNEIYPLVWEIPIDDVYFDDVKLPRSSLSPPSISLSALIDTGNSLIRGPQDVIAQIHSSLGGEDFDCGMPHNLTFQIGGKLFPVDPRDFIHQSFTDSVQQCTTALAVTDPPGDGFLYSWSLGDPFLKSALAAFHYGNLTHPSQDPPRIGLLSTIPTDAAERLRQAVSAAAEEGSGNFPATSQPAPSGTFVATGAGVGGVPQATHVPPDLNGSEPSSTNGAVYTAWSGAAWSPIWGTLGISILSFFCLVL